MNCGHCGAVNADDARFCGGCGRATSATEPSSVELQAPGPPEMIGREIVGRYRILAKLGEGGMGAVFRGEQMSLKRKVAIKLLRPELSRDPGLVRRFNAEAELAAKLSHPNTVNIYDFGQEADGSLFIAMELIEGRSLRQVITQEGPLPPVRALAIGLQIAASLSDAHGHGIVHRDLKPDNVMLTERGRDKDVVRVLDFGIAKLRDADRGTVNAMTRAGDLVGTPQYMAPEQIRSESVDGRTDVYALGAMLYEMVTGRLPFEAPTVMAILSKHLTEVPEMPTVRRPDLGLPRELDALIMSALAKDPSQRPPTMDAMAEHMGALLAQIGGPRSAQLGAMPWSGPVVVPSVPGYSTPHPGAGHATGHPAAAAAGQPSAIPGYPSRTVTPPGRPPGVPRSYPPGVLKPPPAAATPAAAAAPHAPPLQPQPPYPSASQVPYPAPTAITRRSRAPIVIGVVVLAAAAGGAAIFLATRSSSGGGGSGTGSGTSSPGPTGPDDPWGGPDHPGPDQPGPGTGSPGPDDPWGGHGADPAASWGSYRDPQLGWSLALPPGVPATPVVAQGSVNFRGAQGSTVVMVGAFGSPNAGATPSQAEIDQFSAILAGNLGAAIVETGQVMTQGKSRHRVVMADATGRAEARFFIEPHVVLIVYYARSAGWDDAAAERNQFFEKVTLP